VTDYLEVRLYATNGSTMQRVLRQRRGLQVLEEFNGPGGGEVSIPAADATSITLGQVIKVAYNGTIVGGFLVETMGRPLVADDGLTWVKLAGRGLMAWLEDAVVYPQWGLRYYSPVDRPFDFAGVGGNFENRVVWTRPLGVQWRSTTDYREGYPKKWPDRYAWWIWKTSPTSAVADGARNWFRSSITLGSTTRLRFYATADNYFRLFIDGTLLLSTSDLRGEGSTWKKMASRTITLGAGTHHLAAAVTNSAYGSGTNRAGFLCTVTKVTSTGKPGQVVRRTNKTQWWVTDDEPKWYPAEILDVLIDEAQARGVSRLDSLSTGWTADDDSSARAWSTTRALSIRCGTNLLDVANLIVDHGIDLWVDPATNTLEGYETRGTDRSATVLLKARKNLTGYEVEARDTGKTVALVRTADGWTSATNSAGVTARSRRETFLEYGNTRSETTAAAAASRILARTAKTDGIVTRVEAVPVDGARPFLDFHCGDKVTAYSTSGAKSTARVLSIALAEDDEGRITYQPELEVAA
jgi:hypothetical protein